MAILDDVRRKAMEAVFHSEAMAMLRRYGHYEMPPDFFRPSAVRPLDWHPPEAATGPLPEHVKRQAKEAVWHEGVQEIRLVKNADPILPPITPSPKSMRAAQKFAALYGNAHREMTKDTFENYG